MTEPLHKRLQAQLSGLIQSGTFPMGVRFPSIRQTSKEHRLSISTVLEAYRALEEEGWIAARPRSGYFVSSEKGAGARFPSATVGASKPIRLKPGAIFDSLRDFSSDPAFVSFAAAAPGNGIVPESRLAALARDVMRHAGRKALAYTPPQGRLELRTALARRLFEAGMKIGPDEIVTTFGGTEALLLALRATTKPGDLVAVEVPTYFGILYLIRDLGLRVIEIPVNPQTGLVVQALADVLAKRRITACVVQPHFHNPVGSLMPETHKQALAGLADAHGFTIIEDDVYGDLAHDGRRPRSLACFSERVIHCGSASKTIAPGLRVGWMVPGEHLGEVRRLKESLAPWNASLSESIVARFLDAGGYDRHLRRIRSLYADQCLKIRGAVLDRFPDCTRINRPRGGFVLWVEMPKGFDSAAFTEAALGKKILVSPGALFSASESLNHCFRLSCGFAFDERTMEAIATLGKLAPRFLPK